MYELWLGVVGIYIPGFQVIRWEPEIELGEKGRPRFPLGNSERYSSQLPLVVYHA